MTVPTTYAPVQYTGNAVTTAFSFPYTFFSSTDLLVYLDGVLQASGYTVTGGSGASGTVTFSSAPASGVIVTISLSLPYTQLDDYVENQSFPAQTLEAGLDKAALRDQQLNNRLNRALVFPDTLTGALSGELPQPEDGKLLSWSGVLGRIVNVTIGAIANLTTVFTGLSANDFLVYNGANWVNRKHLAKKGTSIASAATTDIGAADSDFIDVTGTTTITSLGATTTRDHVWVNFTGALTLTHNATSLILPSGANIVTAAGDVAEFVRVSGSNWKCVVYQRANGTILNGSAYATAAQGAKADTALQSGSQAEIESETSGKGMDGANAKYHPAMPKAWVNFDGTGTVAIRASYNVSSITDNGTGNYTVNLTTAMSSANYCVVANSTVGTSISAPGWAAKVGNLTTSSFKILTANEGSSTTSPDDSAIVTAMVMGDF